MKIKKNIWFIIIIILFFVIAAFAVEKEKAKEGLVEQVIKMPVKVIEPIVGNKTADKAVEKEKKPPTKEELAVHLKMLLEHEDEVIGFVPGLKKEKDAKGAVSYLYQGVKIEDLDEKSFRTLYAKVQNELNRIRAERLSKQLEAIRQAEQSRRAADQVSRIPRIATPPPQPPQVPKQPAAATQVPKPPPVPPQPPRQR